MSEEPKWKSVMFVAEKFAVIGAGVATMVAMFIALQQLRQANASLEGASERDEQTSKSLDSIQKTQEELQKTQETLKDAIKEIQLQAQSSISTAHAIQSVFALLTGNYAYVEDVKQPQTIAAYGRSTVSFHIKSLVPRQVRGRIIGFDRGRRPCQLTKCDPGKRCYCHDRVVYPFTIEPQRDPLSSEAHEVSFVIATTDNSPCTKDYKLRYLIQIEQPTGGYQTIDSYVLTYEHRNHADDPHCKVSGWYDFVEKVIWGEGGEEQMEQAE